MSVIDVALVPAPGDDPLGLAEFGRQVREARRALNMSQRELGRDLGYSQPTIARIEAGERWMTGKQRKDILTGIAALGPDGGHAPWLGPWLHAERTAVAVRCWDGPIIPGLAQTAGYARYVLGTANPLMAPGELAGQLAARLARQEIWQREDPRPPVFASILSEAALRQTAGSPALMREQLLHLLALASRPGVSIQVLPFGACDSAGVLAPFALASFGPDTRPDVAYVDDAVAGRTTDEREVVAKLSFIYDGLARDALRPPESGQLIERVAGEWMSQAA